MQKSLELSNEDIKWVEQHVFRLSDFELIPNPEPTSLHKRAAVTLHSPNPSGADLASSTKTQPINLKQKFDRVLEKFKDRSFLLWSIIAIPVGAITAYLITNFQNIDSQPVTPNQPTSTSVENTEPQLPAQFLKGEICIEKERKEPLRLFNEPGGYYNDVLLQPGTKVKVTHVNKPESYWVQVMAEEGDGWTYMDNLEDCDN